jgi:hypothetical protein
MLAGKVAMSRRLDSCESQRVLSPGFVNHPDPSPPPGFSLWIISGLRGATKTPARSAQANARLLRQPGHNTRGRSGRLAHQQPEDEHMRHQQQRHSKDGDEIGRAQHARRVGERDG